MKQSLILAAGLVLSLALTPTVGAQDAFSEESEARSWGLATESLARFDGRVVDILCELTGDCAENCGDGRRQLGIVRSADDVLVMVAKNSQPLFTGGSQELLPHCGQDVEVDGLLLGVDTPGSLPYYQIQKIRAAGEAEFQSANRWTRVWAEANPEAKGKGPWFRRDPRIGALIEERGYLGLGLEVDEAFIAEWF